MAFKKVKEIDEDEFLMQIKENPQIIKIVNVGELRESEDGEGLYFYITFENPKTLQTFDIGYNVKGNEEDLLFIGMKSKLFPIASYVSGINNDNINCYYSDIKESLEGLEFKASSKREKFGNKKYFMIVPVGDDE